MKTKAQARTGAPAPGTVGTAIEAAGRGIGTWRGATGLRRRMPSKPARRRATTGATKDRTT